MYALMSFMNNDKNNDRAFKIVGVANSKTEAQIKASNIKSIFDTYVVEIGKWTPLPDDPHFGTNTDTYTDTKNKYYSGSEILELLKTYEGLPLSVLEEKMDKMMDKLAPGKDRDDHDGHDDHDDIMTITI